MMLKYDIYQYFDIGVPKFYLPAENAASSEAWSGILNPLKSKLRVQIGPRRLKINPWKYFW